MKKLKTSDEASYICCQDTVVLGVSRRLLTRRSRVRISLDPVLFIRFETKAAGGRESKVDKAKKWRSGESTHNLRKHRYLRRPTIRFEFSGTTVRIHGWTSISVDPNEKAE